MDIALELRTARRRARLSQRELAGRAGTSQATVSAYESGRKQPTLDTVSRLLDATGSRLVLAAAPAPRSAAELRTSAERLAAVVALAEELPFRRPGPLTYPRLPTAA